MFFKVPRLVSILYFQVSQACFVASDSLVQEYNKVIQLGPVL